MKLKLSKDLAPPPETVTQKLAWLGTTGSGKTYGASKLAEQFWDIGAQFVVIDPVGVWYGLRLAKDGKKPSEITIPIFGGLHGDVPLESTAGALLANLVVDKGLSCIIDVSQFESDAEKARFAADFADRLFFRKKAAPSAMHLFLEECQEFVPQNPQRGEERMLHAFTRMQKLGRNFGIGSSYITQRPQEVNKKALNMAQTLFVFRTTGTHERAAIEKWIEDKSLDQSIAQDLPKILTGFCHVWSPEFLKISELIKISEKETFNASATPEVGVAAKKRELAPIDLEKVRTDMAATIEKAKNDDPRLLRKRIAELELEARAKKPLAEPKPQVKEVRIEVPVLKDGQLIRIENLAEKMMGGIKDFIATLEPLRHPLFMTVDKDAFKKLDYKISIPDDLKTVYKRPTTVKFESKEGGEVEFAATESLEITGPEQRILDAIAWMDGLGTTSPDQALVAPLANYSIYSSNYIKSVSLLRGKGLIESQGKKLRLTDEGKLKARAPEGLLTYEELQQRVLATLSGPEQRILRSLINQGALPDEQVASSAAYSPVSSSYIKSKSVLRGKGLMISEGKLHRAADILFP